MINHAKVQRIFDRSVAEENVPGGPMHLGHLPLGGGSPEAGQ